MKRFIWRIRYAMYWRAALTPSWKFCWDSAVAASGELEQWDGVDPSEAVEDELTCY